MSKKFIVEEQDMLNLLNYLTSRPWGEVHALIAVYSNLKQYGDKSLDKQTGAKKK